MNAFRKFRVLALVGLLTAVVFGLSAATAEAGGCHYGGYGGHTSYSSHYYPSYHYGSYDYSCYYPKSFSYPVTSFDCYGRPFTVWQTGYGTVPVNYLP